jgi:hypothetical protein
MKRHIEETEDEFIVIDERLDGMSITMFPKAAAITEEVRSVSRIKGKEKTPIPNMYGKPAHFTNLVITKENGEKIIIENILREYRER